LPVKSLTVPKIRALNMGLVNCGLMTVGLAWPVGIQARPGPAHGPPSPCRHLVCADGVLKIPQNTSTINGFNASSMSSWCLH